MINLLPPNRAAAIRYGRQNMVLRSWLVGMSLAVGGLIFILAGGWIYMNQQQANLQKNIDSVNQKLQAQNLTKVQKDSKEITDDIKTINKVLGQEIRFSDLIQSIGKVMPPGTVLASLSVEKVTGSLDLTANAKNYSSAARISANLSDPKNGLFTSADIVNVNCSTTNSDLYKCSVALKALFAKGVQSKFLSVPKETK
jgi:Tfp pilus assembly protein PilN